MPDSDFDELPFTSELPGPVAPAFAMAQHEDGVRLPYVYSVNAEALDSMPQVDAKRVQALHQNYVTSIREHERSRAVLRLAEDDERAKKENMHVAKADWVRAMARYTRQQVLKEVDNG